MDRKFRPFIPRFVNSLDHRLLLNKPSIWSTRFHLVGWFSGLALLAFSLLFFLMPNNPRNDSEVFFPTFFLGVLSSIGIIFWLIYVFRFNGFKRYGPTSGGGALVEFILYFMSFGSLLVLPFLPSAIESYRAHRAYSTLELAEDMNRMNFVMAELVYDSLTVNWPRDTLFINDSIVKANSTSSEMIEYYVYVDGMRFCSQKYANDQLLTADSTVSISGDSLVLLNAPDYYFVTNHSVTEHSSVERINRKELYFKVHNLHSTVNKDSLNAEHRRFMLKYADFDDRNNYYTFEIDHSQSSSFLERIGVRELESGISNIASRKYSWYPENWPIYFRIWFYFSIGMTLLLFIFRHSTVRAFFLAILTAVLLMVLTGLVIAFIRGEVKSVLISTLSYSGVFLGLILFSNNQKYRTAVHGIALNLFTAIVGFVPLLIAALYIEIQREYYETYVKGVYDYSSVSTIYFSAEVAGLVLVLLLIPTLIYKSYRYWYALPEE